MHLFLMLIVMNCIYLDRDSGNSKLLIIKTTHRELKKAILKLVFQVEDN